MRERRELLYRSAGRLLLVVVALLAVNSMVGMVSARASWEQLAIASRLQDGETVPDYELTQNDELISTLWTISLVLLLSTATVFLVWWHRVYANLPVLGAETKETPATAVIYFLIPLVNLFKPFKVANEIWEKTAPAGEKQAAPGLLSVWWFGWLFERAANLFAGRYAASAEKALDSMSGFSYWSAEPVDPEAVFAKLHSASQLAFVAECLSIGTPILAILAVTAINRRQEQRWDEVKDDPPPPPPSEPSVFISGEAGLAPLHGQELVAVVPAGHSDVVALFAVLEQELRIPKLERTRAGLKDALTDLSWLTMPRVVIIHEDMPALPQKQREAYLAILAEAVRYWRDQGGRQLDVVFPDGAGGAV